MQRAWADRQLQTRGYPHAHGWTRVNRQEGSGLPEGTRGTPSQSPPPLNSMPRLAFHVANDWMCHGAQSSGSRPRLPPTCRVEVLSACCITQPKPGSLLHGVKTVVLHVRPQTHSTFTTSIARPDVGEVHARCCPIQTIPFEPPRSNSTAPDQSGRRPSLQDCAKREGLSAHWQRQSQKLCSPWTSLTHEGCAGCMQMEVVRLSCWHFVRAGHQVSRTTECLHASLRFTQQRFIRGTPAVPRHR